MSDCEFVFGSEVITRGAAGSSRVADFCQMSGCVKDRQVCRFIQLHVTVKCRLSSASRISLKSWHPHVILRYSFSVRESVEVSQQGEIQSSSAITM